MIIGICTAIFATAGCGSHPIKPEASNVKVTRDAPGKNCESIGKVQGSVSSAKDTFEEALEDLKLDASRKGANFVQIGPTSAYGTSVAGEAYFCR